MFGVFNCIKKTKILQEKIQYLYDELDILADTYVTMESRYTQEIVLLNRKIEALERAHTKTLVNPKGNK